MKNRAAISLEAKLCLLTITTLLVVLLGVGHLSFNGQSSIIVDQKKEAFDALARAIAVDAHHLVAGTDKKLTSKVSNDVKQSRLDLKYVVIQDEKGRVLFSEPNNRPAKGEVSGVHLWQAARRIVGFGAVNDNMYSISVPAEIGGGKRGKVTAGFSMRGAKADVDSMQSKVVLGLSLGLLIGIVCAMGIGRSIALSIRSLIQGAKAVSEGDFKVRIPVKGCREIFDLSEAFNKMVAILSDNHDKLTERANSDSLTGLYNHRFFQERLEEEVNRANRYGHDLSLMMIDIDFFKTFNDTYGHPAGDAAIRSLARILTESVRSIDVPVRYGGEEFAVILPETDAEEARIIAERIRTTVEEDGLVAGVKDRAPLSTSIGVATCPKNCTDRISLLSAADIALYQAKSAGRNRVLAYTGDVTEIPSSDPYKLCVLLQAHDLSLVEAIADAVDAKLKFPLGHSKAVAHLAEATAREMGLPESECEGMYLAGLLRDIGQISVPDQILGKPGNLSEKEMMTIKAHSAMGHAIIQKAPKMAFMLPAILHHHERFDGTGYPSKLAGDSIPMSARILSVADAYESMVTLRPHRRKLTKEEARAELLNNTETQFDPAVVASFIRVLDSAKHHRKAA